jgi:hypothetical protein
MAALLTGHRVVHDQKLRVLRQGSMMGPEAKGISPGHGGQRAFVRADHRLQSYQILNSYGESSRPQGSKQQ